MSAMLYVVRGVEVGRTWYDADRLGGGYYGTLTCWPSSHAPLGPFRTLNAAQKALERAARDAGTWPRSAA